MHTLISSDPGEIAAQRRAVAFAVAPQVPGADPELDTCHGLERLLHELALRGAVDHPVGHGNDAPIDSVIGEAVAEASVTEATVTDTAVTEVTGAETSVTETHTTEAAVPETPDLTTTVVAHTVTSPTGGESTETPVRSELPPSIAPAGDAPAMSTSTRWARQARYQAAPGLTEKRTTASGPAVCRSTRGAMHDYIRHRLLPCRRRELEDHLVDCAECVRAFTDVRESYWLQQAAAPVIPLGTVSVTSMPAMAPAAAAPVMARAAAY